jgi:hypothetical protein
MPSSTLKLNDPFASVSVCAKTTVLLLGPILSRYTFILGASDIVPLTVVPLEDRAAQDATVIREIMNRPNVRFLILNYLLKILLFKDGG